MTIFDDWISFDTNIYISENRHFLAEIPDLPFRVLSAAAALEEMSKLR